MGNSYARLRRLDLKRRKIEKIGKRRKLEKIPNRKKVSPPWPKPKTIPKLIPELVSFGSPSFPTPVRYRDEAILVRHRRRPLPSALTLDLDAFVRRPANISFSSLSSDFSTSRRFFDPNSSNNLYVYVIRNISSDNRGKTKF